MHDFINKKQTKMAQLRANPSLLNDPDFKAKYHQMMAQEQKYLSRIESATSTLRKQEGLSKLMRETGELFTIVKDGDGNLVMKNLGTMAERGAVRSPGNYGKTLAAHAVAQNSLERSIKNMSESLAEAAVKNPKFRATAADDIARLMGTLPDAQKGALIDSLKLKYGDDIAKDLAKAMRNQSTRFSFKKMKAGSLKVLSGIGVAADLYFAAQSLKEYIDNIEKAMNAGISDAEAEAYFKKAQDAANSLVVAGGLGVLMEAYPPFAAAFGAWTIGNVAGEWILKNTETGQSLGRGVLYLADASMIKYEHLKCSAKDYFGYESICEKLRKVDRGVLASVLKALKENRVELVEGATMKDIAQLIEKGKYLEINKLLIKVVVSGAQAGKACANVGEYSGLMKKLDQAVDSESKKIAKKIDKAGDAPDSFRPLKSAFSDIENVASMVNEGNSLIESLAANLAVWSTYKQQLAQIGKAAESADSISVKEERVGQCEGFDPNQTVTEVNQSMESMKASLLAIIFVYESRRGKIDKTLLEEDELILKHLNNIRVAKGKTKMIDPLIEDRQYRSDLTSREQLATLLKEKYRLEELRIKSEKALKEIKEWRENDQKEKDMIDAQGSTMKTIEKQAENQTPISLLGIGGG